MKKKMYSKCMLIVAYLFCIVYVMSGCLSDNRLEVKKLYINDVALYVEIADDPEERMQGLQHRDHLVENWGMLFVYPRKQKLQFWMKDTGIPLDIAFINEEDIIIDIQHMNPYDESLHTSRGKAKYALEVNFKWFKQRGIKVGDTVCNLPR